MFLRKILNLNSGLYYLGVWMGINNFLGKIDEMFGGLILIWIGVLFIG